MSDVKTDERAELERLLAPGTPDAPTPDFEKMWARAEYEVAQRAPRHVWVAAAAILVILAGGLLFSLAGDESLTAPQGHQGSRVAERPSPHPFEGGGEESAKRAEVEQLANTSETGWEAPTDFLLDEALAMETVTFQSTELDLGGESF